MQKYLDLYNEVRTLKDWDDLLYYEKDFNYTEFLLALSNYKKGDEAFRVIGNIGGNWEYTPNESDLLVTHDNIRDNKFVLKSEIETFETYGYDYGYDKYNCDDLANKMAELMGFDNHVSSVNYQPTGSMVNLHVDTLGCWVIGKSEELGSLEFDKEKRQPVGHPDLHRVFVALSDWQPGWMWQFGYEYWTDWKKGDVVWFDWRNVPHATANAGYSPRPIIKISGDSPFIDDLILNNKEPFSFSID